MDAQTNDRLHALAKGKRTDDLRDEADGWISDVPDEPGDVESYVDGFVAGVVTDSDKPIWRFNDGDTTYLFVGTLEDTLNDIRGLRDVPTEPEEADEDEPEFDSYPGQNITKTMSDIHG